MTIDSNETATAKRNAANALVAGGSLKFLTSANAVLHSITLDNPAIGNAVNGVSTFAALPGAVAWAAHEETLAVEGTCAKAGLYTSGGALRETLTVGVGDPGDFEVLVVTTDFVIGGILRFIAAPVVSSPTT
jgi:hypothetical protein